MTSSQYANHVCFRHNQSLKVKQKEMESSGTQIGVNAVNASLWLLIGKACVVRTLTKFLENYLKRKNALQNQVGSEQFAWKNQYCMLYYQLLIIHVVGLWKIWTMVYIDLQDTINLLFWCMIILRKMFAKSFNHAQYWEQEMTTRPIMSLCTFYRE